MSTYIIKDLYVEKSEGLIIFFFNQSFPLENPIWYMTIKKTLNFSEEEEPAPGNTLFFIHIERVDLMFGDLKLLQSP